VGPFRLTGSVPSLAGREVRKILILGDSNGNGTQVDATYSGAAVPGTWTVVEQGTPIAVWPTPSSSPSAGAMPYLVAEIGTGETGWIVRESESGRALDEVTGWTAQLADAYTSVTALADGAPDLIYVVAGANDAADAAEAGRFEGHARRTLAILRDWWPDASIVWLQERETATPPSAYDLLVPTIHPAIATVCAEVGAHVIDGEALAYTMADDIHASQDATGQGAIAAAIAALWSP